MRLSDFLGFSSGDIGHAITRRAVSNTRLKVFVAWMNNREAQIHHSNNPARRDQQIPVYIGMAAGKGQKRFNKMKNAYAL